MIGLLRWGPVSATDGFRLDIDVLAMYIKYPLHKSAVHPSPIDCCHNVIVSRA